MDKPAAHAVVVSVSLGTAFLLFVLTVVVVLGTAVATVGVHSQTTQAPSVFRPKTGVIGEIEQQINDLKYGPVNVSATKEVKNGLFDRIRANRQSRLCQPAQQACSLVQPQAICYSQPISPSYSYTTANPIVTQSTGFDEMPITAPINPLLGSVGDCPSCDKSRAAVKTGTFICSNCRQSQVGNWHTDWNADGTPTTFLCKRCHAVMSPDQRERAFTAYQARQFSKLSHSGLLHQELGQ